MPIGQESDNAVLDMVGVLLESYKKPQYVNGPDGVAKLERVIDEHRVWWQAHHIGTNNLGEFAKELEGLRNLANNAFYHMSSTRARAVQDQLLKIVAAYEYSIDAKGSESRIDDHNTNQTVLAMLAKAKTERQYTLKGDVKAGFMDGIMGRKANEGSN